MINVYYVYIINILIIW